MSSVRLVINAKCRQSGHSWACGPTRRVRLTISRRPAARSMPGCATSSLTRSWPRTTRASSIVECPSNGCMATVKITISTRSRAPSPLLPTPRIPAMISSTVGGSAGSRRLFFVVGGLHYFRPPENAAQARPATAPNARLGARAISDGGDPHQRRVPRRAKNRRYPTGSRPARRRGGVSICHLRQLRSSDRACRPDRAVFQPVWRCAASV